MKPDAFQGAKISLGIKSSYNPDEGSLTVTEILPDSPAESILHPFDRILRIDSESLKGKSLKELNSLLEGDAGIDVKLTVNRAELFLPEKRVILRTFQRETKLQNYVSVKCGHDHRL
jgi:C-terminal processing protease CtpA/Prc